MRSYLQKHNNNLYSNDWSTPNEIYNYYIHELKYYDPCPLFANDFNFNLGIIYGNMFINPPYKEIAKWVLYAIEYVKLYNFNVVLLIPSRTDTKYFHALLNYGVDLEFIKGRLKFGNQKGSAPFPSVLIHLRGEVK